MNRLFNEETATAERKRSRRDELHEGYCPANNFEQGYVDRMAEHTWLRQCCLSLRNDCFDPECAHRYINDEKPSAFGGRNPQMRLTKRVFASPTPAPHIEVDSDKISQTGVAA